MSFSIDNTPLTFAEIDSNQNQIRAELAMNSGIENELPLELKNGVDKLRHLAQQAFYQGYPIIFYPMYRRTLNKKSVVTDSDAATATKAIQNGKCFSALGKRSDGPVGPCEPHFEGAI